MNWLHSPSGRASFERSRARRKAAIHGHRIDSKLTVAQWEEIKVRFDHRCAYCFCQPGRLEKDHVVALLAGGHHVASNIAPACRSCNASKSAKSLMLWLFPEGL